MNYSSVYLFFSSILIIFLEFKYEAEAAAVAKTDVEDKLESLSTKVQEHYKKKCGNLPDFPKVQEYLTKCNGIDPKKVSAITDLIADLCLGVINNIFVSCDKKSNDVLEYLSDTKSEKFKDLNVNISVCPLETIQIDPFFESVDHFQTLSNYLSKNLDTCLIFCSGLSNDVLQDCTLWHTTNAILKNKTNESNFKIAAQPKLENSEITSHNDKKKITAADVKTNSSQERTVPKQTEAQQNKSKPQFTSTKEEVQNLGTAEHLESKSENKSNSNKSVPTIKESTDVVADLAGSNTQGEIPSLSNDRKENPEPTADQGKTRKTTSKTQQVNESLPNEPQFDTGKPPEYDLKSVQDDFNDDREESNNDEDATQPKFPDDNFDSGNHLKKETNFNLDVGSLPSTQQNEDTYISKNSQPAGPSKSEDIYIPDNDLFTQTEDSHFFMYFLTSASIVILGYVAFHNKNKILAYALEGRRSRNSRRRPNSASYRKLECSLEEAITSNSTHSSVTNVVY